LDAQFIDRIYESAFVPELWPDVLAQLANIATARSGWMAISRGGKHHFSGSNQIVREAVAPLVEGGLVFRADRFARLCASCHPGFLREVDIYTDAELESDPFYQKYLFPRGLGRAAATTFVLPTQDSFLISLEREAVRGPVEASAIEELDALRPHIARSAFMAARLQLDRARAASATLAALGLPALVLDEKGKVLVANQLIEASAGIFHWRAHDAIGLVDRVADKLLRDAIATIDLSGGGCVRSFPVRDAAATLVAHVIPIRLSARDMFARCIAVLALTPVSLPQAPPVELVQSLFDLTPAEARVARGLASGMAVEAIAADRGVSPNTIRSHVRGVFEKTGCTRQAEVVALFNGISPLRQ
jgi:DNA-binding CsgD family transcriptional regulator